MSDDEEDNDVKKAMLHATNSKATDEVNIVLFKGKIRGCVRNYVIKCLLLFLIF